MNCALSVYGIYISGQLSCDVIGCLSRPVDLAVMLLAVLNLNRLLSRDAIGCLLVKPWCYRLPTSVKSS